MTDANSKEQYQELAKEFITSQDAEQEDLLKLIPPVMEHCRVDESGYIQLISSKALNLSVRDKVMLVLVARHLASKLQAKTSDQVTIKEEVDIEEISKFLREKKNVVSARLGELVDMHQAFRVNRGVYRATRHSIPALISEIGGVKE